MCVCTGIASYCHTKCVAVNNEAFMSPMHSPSTHPLLSSSAVPQRAQISFQVTSSPGTNISCSRLSPQLVNPPDYCPPIAPVRVECSFTYTPSMVTVPGTVTFNGNPVSSIPSFGPSNNGLYRCDFQNTCGSMNRTINITVFGKCHHSQVNRLHQNLCSLPHRTC